MNNLKNYMENLVESKYNEMIQKQDICKCEKCKMDIMSFALNNLSPKYIVSDKGELYTKINELILQFNIDVEVEVANAIKLVRNNPRHL